jgi:hypothetical protein
MILCLVGWFNFSESQNPNHSIVILMDDSFYAQRPSYIQTQKRNALEIINGASPHQEVAIAGRSGNSSPWLNINEAKTFIKNWEPSFKEENWDLVSHQMAKKHRHRHGTQMEIHIFGEALTSQPTQLKQALHKRPKSYIIKEKLIRTLPPKNTQLLANAWTEKNKVILKGETSPSTENATIRFTSIHGHTQTKTINGHFTWSLEPFQGKADAGKIEWLNNDELAIDNTFYFQGEHSLQKKIILVSPKEASQRLQNSSYYLQKGLTELSRAGKWSFTSSTPFDWHGIPTQNGDTIILHHPMKLSTKEIDSLSKLCQKGGHIFFFMGPQTPVDALDEFPYLPAKPLSIGFEEFNVQWPQHWKTHIPDFCSQQLLGGYRFKDLHPKTIIHSRRNDGSPFWISRSLEEGGTIHLCSSPYHIAWSTISLKVDFLNSLDYFLTHHEKTSPTPPLQLGEPPKMVQSLRVIMGESNIDHLKPGIIDIEYGKTKKLRKTINFDPLLVKPRIPFSIPEDTNRSSSQTITHKRIDHIFAIIAAIFILLEASYLLSKKRTALSSNSLNP